MLPDWFTRMFDDGDDPPPEPPAPDMDARMQASIARFLRLNIMVPDDLDSAPDDGYKAWLATVMTNRITCRFKTSPSCTNRAIPDARGACGPCYTLLCIARANMRQSLKRYTDFPGMRHDVLVVGKANDAGS